MAQSWKARQMVPGHDTISVMAMHYGFSPTVIRDVIVKAGVEVIREDGFRGKLSQKHRVVGWSDGQVGLDLKTTKLTKEAIRTVSLWAFEKMYGNDSDN